jgi:hypothetical protein
MGQKASAQAARGRFRSAVRVLITFAGLSNSGRIFLAANHHLNQRVFIRRRSALLAHDFTPPNHVDTIRNFQDVWQIVTN